MKSLFLKLIPGAAVAVAVFAIGAFSLLHAQSKSEAVTSPAAQIAPVSQQQPAPLLVCGHCGEYLQAPQTIVVAMPLHPREQPRQFVRQGGNGAGQAFYGMPPMVQQYPAAPSCSPAAYYYDGWQQPAPRQTVFPMTDYWQLPAQYFPAPVGRGHTHQGERCR